MNRLGTFEPGTLGAARGQAHQAAQLIAAAGETYLPHAPDTSHTSMEWLGALGALAGGRVSANRPFRLALRINDLHLLLLDDQDAICEAHNLDGSTADQSQKLARSWAHDWTGGALDRKWIHPGYDLPTHPTANGQSFQVEPKALGELARWFEHAHHALQNVAGDARDEATPIRCWPHHFDLALLLEIEHDTEGVATRSVGVGLSPGDETYPEPYWYVNHWPGARSPELVALPGGGQWHTQGWTGCVLRASAIAAEPLAADQDARVAAFLRRAVQLNRGLAGS